MRSAPNFCRRWRISAKDDESYSHTITWIRTRLSFDLVQSAIACVRGSRTPFRKHITDVNDFELKNIRGIWQEWGRVCKEAQADGEYEKEVDEGIEILSIDEFYLCL